MYKKYEKHFEKIYEASPVRYRTFPHHVEIVRQWAEKLCDAYPEADRDVVVIAALFHDLGHFISDGEPNHAVSSEKETERFLKAEGAPAELTRKVMHAVRSHRNGDVKPETLEAKIIVFSDSASHMTTPDVYLYIAADNHGNKQKALEKLERDWRDLALFPEHAKKMKPLYKAWKDIITVFPEEFYPHIRKVEEFYQG